MKRMQPLIQSIRAIILTIIFIQTLFTTVSAEELTPLKLSSIPLFLGNPVPPNMLIILDNSLSTDYDIMAKAHWERAAYESVYASGNEYVPIQCCKKYDILKQKCCDENDAACIGQPRGDCGQLETCSDPDGDCGILRQDGAITLSGPPDLNGLKNNDEMGNRMRNYLPYLYLSSCRGINAPCSNIYDDNAYRTDCTAETAPGTYSLANCPETEALDWRVRSAALNVLYYNPNINYKVWKFYDLPVDAAFTAVRRSPYSNNKTAYNSKINLGKTAPLGIDPASCISTESTKCKLANFGNGFTYYIWVDDKGYKTEDGRPHRGSKINMTDDPNGMVDLWDTRYKVTVTENSMTVEQIKCEKGYIGDGLLKGKLKCEIVPGSNTDKIPVNLIPDRVSVNLEGPTLQEEQLNIAYWYQFYRRRLFTLKGMITNLPYFAPQYRYGLMSLGEDGSTLYVASNDNMGPIDEMKKLTDALIFEFPISDLTTQPGNFQQNNIMKALFKLKYFGSAVSNGTPMRETLNRAGRYYAYTGSNGEPLITGTTVSPITAACQRNYSLIITDGYYTVSGSTFSRSDGNSFADEDGDGSAVTLADVARYYYKTDLKPSNTFPNILTPVSCDNRPPQSCVNCDKNQYYPTYQHMVTFGIAVGVDGKLQWGDENKKDGWPNSIVPYPPGIVCPPSPGTTNAWNKTGASWAEQPMNCSGENNDCPQKIDDLWHAAYNSHGAYIPVKTPKELEDALSKVLGLISIDRAFASSASSSSYFEAGNMIFQTGFEGQYWTGDLKAYTVTVDAAGNVIVSQSAKWSAAEKLNNYRYGDRNILSYSSSAYKAINFTWSELELDEAARDALNRDEKGNEDKKGEARVDFIRGRGAGTGINKDEKFIGPEDQGGYNFRPRPSLLGDIIQSDPVYVGESSFRYDEYDCGDECTEYSAFKSDTSNRDPMVYVGANDGMLHGFDAETGEEIMAYVPARLIGKLSALTSRNYTHQFYVDGSATVGDAYIDGQWRTVLVGSLRAGGQAVFAIDINEPNNPKVLWEFSDKDDADLGYTFGKPVIARLQNGRWAAIFGNGYNNIESDGSIGKGKKAVLYMVYLDKTTPEFIKLETDPPEVEDPTGANRPNGFATPAVVDVDFDTNFAVDYIYVGDLFGNLWKFDISSGLDKKGKLFQAYYTDENNKTIYQSITTRPVVSYHPVLGRDGGYMIYFGTGKYFESGDNLYKEATIQSFYGIWDDDLKGTDDDSTTLPLPITRADLYQQVITPINDEYRTLTPAKNEPIKWSIEGENKPNRGWYIDFPLGEKQVTNAAIWNDRVIFTTLVLPEDPQSCDSDGSFSWLMVVDSSDGGALTEPTFDLNGDYRFDSADLIASAGGGTVHPAGKKSSVGALPALALGLAFPADIQNGSGGNVAVGTCGRTRSPYLRASGRGTGGQVFTAIINPGPDIVGRQSWRQLWR